MAERHSGITSRRRRIKGNSFENTPDKRSTTPDGTSNSLCPEQGYEHKDQESDTEDRRCGNGATRVSGRADFSRKRKQDQTSMGDSDADRVQQCTFWSARQFTSSGGGTPRYCSRTGTTRCIFLQDPSCNARERTAQGTKNN